MGIFAYYDTESEAVIYHVVPSPESDRPPSTIYSDEESMASGTTIESDELPGFFIAHYGRQQPASKNVAKWFPSDNIKRHAFRHLMIKSLFGSYCPGPAVEMLAPIDGRKRHALELGTKTGIWIQSLATELPHVQFLTLDIVPLVPHLPLHNVIFEVYDYTEGLLVEDESQDAVFLNYIMELVKDYRGLVREAYRVLRPGGLIQIIDFSPQPWDPEDVTRPAREGPSRARHLLDLVHRRVGDLGIDPETCEKLPQWLAPESDLWDKSQKGFKDIHSTARAQPLYPHDGFSCMDHTDRNLAPYLRHFVDRSTRDMFGILKDAGVADEEAEALIEDTIRERSQHEHCVLLKTYCIHATKI